MATPLHRQEVAAVDREALLPPRISFRSSTGIQAALVILGAGLGITALTLFLLKKGTWQLYAFLGAGGVVSLIAAGIFRACRPVPGAELLPPPPALFTPSPEEPAIPLDPPSLPVVSPASGQPPSPPAGQEPSGPTPGITATPSKTRVPASLAVQKARDDLTALENTAQNQGLATIPVPGSLISSLSGDEQRSILAGLCQRTKAKNITSDKYQLRQNLLAQYTCTYLRHLCPRDTLDAAALERASHVLSCLPVDACRETSRLLASYYSPRQMLNLCAMDLSTPVEKVRAAADKAKCAAHNQKFLQAWMMAANEQAVHMVSMLNKLAGTPPAAASYALSADPDARRQVIDNEKAQIDAAMAASLLDLGGDAALEAALAASLADAQPGTGSKFSGQDLLLLQSLGQISAAGGIEKLLARRAKTLVAALTQRTHLPTQAGREQACGLLLIAGGNDTREADLQELINPTEEMRAVRKESLAIKLKERLGTVSKTERELDALAESALIREIDNARIELGKIHDQKRATEQEVRESIANTDKETILIRLILIQNQRLMDHMIHSLPLIGTERTRQMRFGLLSTTREGRYTQADKNAIITAVCATLTLDDISGILGRCLPENDAEAFELARKTIEKYAPAGNVFRVTRRDTII